MLRFWPFVLLALAVSADAAAPPTNLTFDARPCVYDAPTSVYDGDCVLQ